jgi:hypothetical protein
MSKTASIPQSARVQKVCTLWTHDDNFSRDEIVFNGEKFPELPTSAGALLQIVAIHTDNAVRDFHTGPKSTSGDATQSKTDTLHKDANVDHHPKRHRRDSITITIDENGSTIPEGRQIDTDKAYVFVPKALPANLESKYPNLQVSYT